MPGILILFKHSGYGFARSQGPRGCIGDTLSLRSRIVGGQLMYSRSAAV